MIFLKGKISQYKKNKYPANQMTNTSNDETARKNIDALIKQEKYRT